MKRFFARFFTMIAGLILFAIGIVLTIRANIGYPPWDVFHVGLTKVTGLSLGTVSIIIGILIGIVVTVMGEKLGFGSILNVVLIGIFIDIIIPLVPVMENQITGTAVLILGLFIVSLGSYFYIKSGFGVGPRDNLMVVLARKTRLPVGLCRFIIEFIVTLVGWVLGGMVWFGTVISVIAIGFFIQITFRAFRFDVTTVKHETMFDTFAALKKKYRDS